MCMCMCMCIFSVVWLHSIRVRWPSGLRRCTQVKACRLRRSVVICIISGCVGSTPTLTTYLFLFFKSVYCIPLWARAWQLSYPIQGYLSIIWFMMLSGICDYFSPSSMDRLSCRRYVFSTHLSSSPVFPLLSRSLAFPLAITTHLIGPPEWHSIKFAKLWETMAFRQTLKFHSSHHRKRWAHHFG